MSELDKNWKAVVDRKRAQRQALLPPRWLVPHHEIPGQEAYDVTNICAEKGWLTAEELDITGKTITELAKVIKDGKVSALTVVNAFAHRATIAQQLLNWYVPLSMTVVAC
jgi:amidase